MLWTVTKKCGIAYLSNIDFFLNWSLPTDLYRKLVTEKSLRHVVEYRFGSNNPRPQTTIIFEEMEKETYEQLS